MKNQITLEDTTSTMLLKLSKGNPGAISVLVRMLKEGESIDPDSMSPFMAILQLDSMGINNGSIWMLYKDICGQDLEKMLGVLRGVQLGLLSEEHLLAAIESRYKGVSVDDLLSKVKKELPNFGLKPVVICEGEGEVARLIRTAAVTLKTNKELAAELGISKRQVSKNRIPGTNQMAAL